MTGIFAPCPPGFQLPFVLRDRASAGGALAPGLGLVTDPAKGILLVEDELALSRHVVAARADCDEAADRAGRVLDFAAEFKNCGLSSRPKVWNDRSAEAWAEPTRAARLGWRAGRAESRKTPEVCAVGDASGGFKRWSC
jgi:hypothetical protein